MKVKDELFSLERISRVSQAFEKMGCAQLQDASSEHTHVLNLPIVCRTPRKRMAGPVFPVETANDMLPCLQALDQAPPGSILFIQNTAEQSEALAGDIFVTAAYQQGLGGLIVNGAVRDIDFLPELNFPVFSRSVTYVSAKTAEIPAVKLPCSIYLGTFLLEPGDWIFGDSDGLLLIKQKHLSAVFAAATVLRDREETLKTALLKGQRLGVICGLEDFLAGRGELKFEG
ncbi:demethylmenaquinone methyltransferase [Hapalosiphon sp. MRB220]|nr:demethylmenaquinone methyltransferase [Hapalosiphon sp. MRB220]